MIYPILQLRLMSFACPCGELDEDRDARVAAFTLQSIPITWHRKVLDPNVKAADELVHDLTGMRLPSKSTTMYIGFKATLSVIDTTDGPALEIISEDPQLQHHDIVREGHTTVKQDGGVMYAIQSALKGGAPLVREVVLLKDMDTIVSGNTAAHSFGIIGTGRVQCDIKVYGKPLVRCGNNTTTGTDTNSSSPFYGTGRTDGTSTYGSGKKILQFDVLEDSNHDDDDALQKSINAQELLNHLNAVVSWDRRTNQDFRSRYMEEQRRIEEAEAMEEEVMYYGHDDDDDSNDYESQSYFYQDQGPNERRKNRNLVPTNHHNDYNCASSIVAPLQEIWTS